MSVFFDTNVLIYSISADPADAAKRERAITLLERDDDPVSIQVLQEFYTPATPQRGRSSCRTNWQPT